MMGLKKLTPHFLPPRLRTRDKTWEPGKNHRTRSLLVPKFNLGTRGEAQIKGYLKKKSGAQAKPGHQKTSKIIVLKKTSYERSLFFNVSKKLENCGRFIS